MRTENTRRGFTLIELLVIVLIIGILAAIALPQYQKAVWKSRVKGMTPTLRGIVEAMDYYYMEKGSFTSKWNDVTLSLPCQHVPNSSGADLYACNNEWLLTLNNDGAVMAAYCPGKNTSYWPCINVRDLQLEYYSQHSSADTSLVGQYRCVSWDSIGKSVCTSLLEEGHVGLIDHRTR